MPQPNILVETSVDLWKLAAFSANTLAALCSEAAVLDESVPGGTSIAKRQRLLSFSTLTNEAIKAAIEASR